MQIFLGRGGGLVVSVPAFCSNDPSLNPAGYFINFLYEKTKIYKKEAGVGPSFKNVMQIFITFNEQGITSKARLWLTF